MVARALTIFLAIFSMATSPGVAQSLPIDSILKANRLPITFEDDRPSGPGWDFILDAANGTQFVMVGESHNVREIPLFSIQLFESLHERYGFNYVTLEDGPYAVEQYVSPDVRGDLNGAFALGAKYVQSLQFWNDQEIQLLSAAGRISTAPEHPVWGVDNTWGTLHILEALVALAPDPENRALVEAFANESRTMEAERPEDNDRFITRGLTRERLRQLEQAFQTAGPEAHRLLGYLRTGYETYAARTGGPANYTANVRREDLMRRQFMTQYRRAVANGDTLPRVLLKFGQWHAMKALNWGNVQSFGLLVSEFAKSNDSQSLHIWTGLVNEPGHFWTLHDFEDYIALAQAGATDGWYVIDVRPFRGLVTAGQVTGMNDELYKVIFGFDLALLIGGGNPATDDRLVEAGRRR